MATITFNVDDKLKQEASELYSRMGLDMSSALRLFMTQSVNLRRIPFEIKVPEVDETMFDENGVLITRERQLDTKKWISDFADKGIIPTVIVDPKNPESLEQFFEDEDFSEYEDVFNG